ncbi:MAG: hypothetical protein LBP63_10195 [Prevotellaceae bacterium]|jgi:hypothetical protein|nr:hypothetical protein [Prevotellaceae bacterium]
MKFYAFIEFVTNMVYFYVSIFVAIQNFLKLKKHDLWQADNASSIERKSVGF